MLWFKNIKESKDNLENHIESINEMIKKFNVDANSFKGKFDQSELPANMNHMQNFEVYERFKAESGQIESTNVPGLHQLSSDYQRLVEEN